MSVSFSPIGPWLVVVVAALGVTVLTLWAYQQRLRGTQGRWRWVALGLRLAAVLLCVLAAFRPSVVIQEKKKQPAAIVFLIDDSASMKLNDEVRGQTRWGVALKTLSQSRAVTQDLGPNLDAKFYRFDNGLRDQRPEDTAEANGRETAIGAALLDALRRQAGTRVATIVLLSDGANNAGLTPLVAARQLRGQQVPVVTVGFGSENAGSASQRHRPQGDLRRAGVRQEQAPGQGDARRSGVRQPADRRRDARRGPSRSPRRRSRPPRGRRSSRSPG